MFKRYTFLFLLFIGLSSIGWGQILTFEVSSLSGTTSTLNHATKNANLGNSTLSRGSGLTAASAGAGFSSSNYANTFQADDYLEFKITPNTNYKFSVTTISFYVTRSSSGPPTAVLRNSLDSYSSNIDGTKSVTTSSSSISYNVNLSNQTSEVTFRLYCYGTTNSGGTFRITDNSSAADIIVSGSVDVNMASEPTTNAALLPFTSVSNMGMTINWTEGDGAGRSVFVKEGSGDITAPTDGTTYTPSADWTLKGTQLGSSGYYCVFDGTGTSVSLSNLSPNTPYFVYIYEYNGSSTSINYFTTSPANGSQTTASSSNDANSDILTPDTQVEAKNIASTVNQLGDAVEVFKFRIQDIGTSDAKPTKVTNIKLIQGADNSVSWTSAIQGVLVKKDGNAVTTGTVSIANDAINIPITSGNLDVNDNSTSEVTILVYLQTSGITDNQILAFKIPQVAHGFTTDGSGSGFASSISADISSNQHTITVTASKLNFSSYPPTVSLNTNFTVSVEATDANGNRDLDATNSVTLGKSSGGTGTLSATGGLTKSLVSGSYTWDDLQFDTQQPFEISASADGLSSAYASNIGILLTVNATDLFISEYVEGGSNNKYIEIFNGTGGSINLANYSLKQYNNGSGTATYTLSLSGLSNLDNNSTLVVMNSSATTLGTGINKLSTSNQVMTFNGDDAIALFNGSNMIDLIGTIGEDPGSGWTSGSHSTVDKTLRRKSSILSGITTSPSSGFPTLTTEWDVYNIDVLTGLGSHTFNSTSVVGSQTVATGTNTYAFTDKYLRLEFTSVTTGGTIQVAFYGNPPTNATGLPGNVSQYRWVITNNGVVGFTVNFRVKRDSFLGLNSGTPGNSDVKLYKRETPGSGTFTDFGFMTYDSDNDEYYKEISSFSEIIVQSESEPLPVELTSFTASAKGTSVILNWETKTEVDNNGFEVERNSTGTWQKIGFVEGHGTANSPKYYSFSDNSVLGNKIQYRLKQIDNDGAFEYSPTVEVELNPTQFALYQNYPNPFNPSTIIRYSMPVGGNVSIEVYNTLGEKITSLVNSQVEAGYHEVSFDATNLPSGLYFYKINTDGYSAVKKMLLMK